MLVQANSNTDNTSIVKDNFVEPFCYERIFNVHRMLHFVVL